MNTALVILLAIAALAGVIALVQFLVSTIKFISKSIIMAPGKGIKKLFGLIKGMRLSAATRKRDKLVLKELKKAHLNAARSNPNFKTEKVVELELKIKKLTK